jgi:hypothetical protein
VLAQHLPYSHWSASKRRSQRTQSHRLKITIITTIKSQKKPVVVIRSHSNRPEVEVKRGVPPAVFLSSDPSSCQDEGCVRRSRSVNAGGTVKWKVRPRKWLTCSLARSTKPQLQHTVRGGKECRSCRKETRAGIDLTPGHRHNGYVRWAAWSPTASSTRLFVLHFITASQAG